MRKYPVLRGLSGLARFIGWAGLILGGIMVFVGIIIILSAASSMSQYPGGMGIFGFYSGFGALSVGVGLSIASIYLIILGEVINVFLDIEGNTSATVHFLKSLIAGRLANDPTSGTPGSAAVEPSRSVERKSVPAGFRETNRRAEAGDEVFHPVEGLGVVTRPGRNRYFVWVRFQDGQEEKEMERFSLYQKHG
jgi:hypothetical protein